MNKRLTSVFIQLIVTTGTVLGGVLLTIRYAINKNSAKDKSFLEYLEKSEAKQLEYYEKKNGHLERISNEFSKAIDRNTREISKLSKKIK